MLLEVCTWLFYNDRASGLERNSLDLMYVVAYTKWADQQYQTRSIIEERYFVKSEYVTGLMLNTAILTPVRTGCSQNLHFSQSNKPTYTALILYKIFIQYIYIYIY